MQNRRRRPLRRQELFWTETPPSALVAASDDHDWSKVAKLAGAGVSMVAVVAADSRYIIKADGRLVNGAQILGASRTADAPNRCLISGRVMIAMCFGLVARPHFVWLVRRRQPSSRQLMTDDGHLIGDDG